MKKRKIINIRPKTAALALTLTTILGGLGLINAHAEEATPTKPTDFEEPKYAHGLIIEGEKQVTNLVNGLEYEIEDVEEASKKEVINVYGGGFIPRTIITEDENEVKEGEHTHKLGEWVAVNDVFEESYCPEDGTLVGRRNHLYHATKIEYKSNEDGTEEKVTIGKCLTCGHEITLTRTKLCDYNKVIYDENNEYEICDHCDFVHPRGKHNLDNGVRKGNEIVYTCQNEGCDYTRVREYKPGYNHGGGSSSGGGSSRPTNPDKPVHTHYLGEWVSLNDDLEASYCPEDGALVETRAHKYTANTNIVSNHDGTHTTTTTYTCSNCNHVKSESKTETKTCDYSKITYDDTYEYGNCECGDKHTIGTHKLDKGTINDTNTYITYSCTNPGCGYTKTEKYTKPGHIHDYGETKNSYSATDNTHHTHTVYQECTAGDDTKIISKTTEGCIFGLTNTSVVDGKTIETYTCKNNCGNSYTKEKTETTTHTHKYGEWQDNGNNEVQYCIEPGCTNPVDKKFKPHAWGEWNTDHTKRECTTCTATETHVHTFGANTTKLEKNGSTNHDVVTIKTCTDNTCNYSEEVSRTTENCSFTKTIAETDTTITKECACGNTYVENKTTTHTHNYGVWTDNGQNEIRHCIDTNCTVPGGASETRDHTWGEWNSDHTKRNCTTCTATETHTHDFKSKNTNTPNTSGENGTHIHIVTNECACGQTVEVSREVENCVFTKGEETTNEVTGEITTTYSCVCGNSYQETKTPTTHTHSGGNLQERKGTGDTCYITYKICDTCHQEYELSNHGHDKVLNGDGDYECTKCGKVFNGPVQSIASTNALGIDDETKKLLEKSDEEAKLLQEKSDAETNNLLADSDAEALALKQKSDEETRRLLEESEAETKRLLEESAKETATLLGTDNDAPDITEEETEDLTNKEIDAIIEETDNAIKEITDNADARLAEAMASNNATDEVIDTIIEETDKAIADISEYADAKLAALIANRKTVLVRARRSYR